MAGDDSAARDLRAPSGEQFELRHGDRHAVVVEVGGALRTFHVAGRAVLDGYGEQEMCTDARAQTLIPWPNRLRDGSYEFEGERQQLALSEPDKQNAIHGLVRFARWTVSERSAERIVMSHRLHPQPGYPFALDLAVAYRLSPAGLEVSLTAVNVGAHRCPFGAGAHPYLTVGTATVDEAILRAPGARWMATDERQIPSTTHPVEGTDYDFRQPRPIGATKLDTGYADLERDGDGLARVELRDRQGERSVVLWVDDAYRFLMLYTGDTLPDPARRRAGLGVEPMTCAPNAFQTGEGLVVLEPGERFTAAWGIAVS